MSRNIRLDCVAMKDQIQQKLLSEWSGIRDDQIAQKIRRDLRVSKTPIGSWWRRLAAKKITDATRTAVAH